MTISFKYADKGTSDTNVFSRLADRIHIILHSDQILEIRDSGCQVFD